MQGLIRSGLMFMGGVACTITLMAMLGADHPAAQNRQLDTEVIPIAGGMALVLSINDRANNKLYLYELPVKKDRPVNYRGHIDLSAVGQDTLPAQLNIAD